VVYGYSYQTDIHIDVTYFFSKETIANYNKAENYCVSRLEKFINILNKKYGKFKYCILDEEKILHYGGRHRITKILTINNIKIEFAYNKTDEEIETEVSEILSSTARR